MSCGVGGRRGSDPALVWLCQRLAAAALLQPLAWEPPYAASIALKSKKKKSQLDKRKRAAAYLGYDFTCLKNVVPPKKRFLYSSGLTLFLNF